MVNKVLGVYVSYLRHYTKNLLPDGKPWGWFDPKQRKILDAEQVIAKLQRDKRFAEQQCVEHILTAMNGKSLVMSFNGHQVNGPGMAKLLQKNRKFRKQVCEDDAVVEVVQAYFTIGGKEVTKGSADST